MAHDGSQQGTANDKKKPGNNGDHAGCGGKNLHYDGTQDRTRQRSDSLLLGQDSSPDRDYRYQAFSKSWTNPV